MKTTLIYPSALPTIASLNLTPAERRLLGPADGPFSARSAQRDWLASADVTFPPFTSDEAAAFRTWWTADLVEGGAWFASDWPLPAGMALGVWRFMTAPQWSFIAGGFWRVSATMEVRGRGLLPQKVLSQLAYTSWPYALIADEQIAMGSAFPRSGQLWQITQEQLSFGPASPISGTLVNVVHGYDQPAESFTFGAASPISGALLTVLHNYDQTAAEKASFGVAYPRTGTLNVVLVSYTNAQIDQLAFANAIPLSGTLS